MRFSNLAHYLKQVSLLVLISVAASACASNLQSKKKPVNLNGTWSEVAIPNQRVNKLKPSDTFLYAGTDEGVFKLDVSGKRTKWENIGLGTDSTTVVDIIAWSEQEIMVARQYEKYNAHGKVLLKTNDGGKNWTKFGNGFEGEGINKFVTHIALSSDKPDRIFAMGGLPIARSTDRGQSWKAVYKTWKLAAFGQFLKIDRKHQNIIWAGGSTNLFTTRLVKSTDGGDTWQSLSLSPYGNGTVNGTVYDLIINASNSDHVIAGLNIGLHESNDGGQTWSTIFTEAEIYSFTHSARDPQVIYASGLNENTGSTGTLFFAASQDFGDTWQTVTMPDSPAGIYVNDMVSVMQDGHEVLYLGTSKGVYSYTFKR